jgi:branched-chain amino acid aminotransferase
MADEVFFTGTAAEITPVRSIDKITIGAGKPGPVTTLMQTQYLDIVHGRVADTHGWLTHCRA